MPLRWHCSPQAHGALFLVRNGDSKATSCDKSAWQRGENQSPLHSSLPLVGTKRHSVRALSNFADGPKLSTSVAHGRKRLWGSSASGTRAAAYLWQNLCLQNVTFVRPLPPKRRHQKTRASHVTDARAALCFSLRQAGGQTFGMRENFQKCFIIDYSSYKLVQKCCRS